MHEIRTAEPAGYAEFLAELKQRIERAQLQASLAVNRELVLLYWQIGREILSRQDRESWGAKVIDRLAVDLKRSFPDMRGFCAVQWEVPFLEGTSPIAAFGALP